MYAAAHSLESTGGDHFRGGKPWRGIGAPPETVRVVGGYLHRDLHRGGAATPSNRVGVVSVRRIDGDTRDGGDRRQHPQGAAAVACSRTVVMRPSEHRNGGFW